MKQALWTPLAQLELEEILFYIRAEGGRPETARRIGEEMVELVNHHAAFGTVGHRHSAAPESWFYLNFKRWLIFYQIHPNGIEVMRIVDAARDLPTFLR